MSSSQKQFPPSGSFKVISPSPPKLPRQNDQLDSFLENIAITPISAVRWHCEPTWFQSPRRLQDSMWYFNESGKCKCWIDNPANSFELNPGDLFMIPQNCLHEVYPVTPEPIRSITVHFLIENSETADSLFLLGIKGVFRDTSSCNFKKINDRLVTEFATHLPGFRCSSHTLLMQLLVGLVRTYGNRLTIPTESAYKRILPLLPVFKLVNEKIADPEFCIAEMAAHICVSEVYLRRLFKLANLPSPLKYINKKRIDTASLLLRTTSISIKQIAARCGFQNTHYFFRTFKAQTSLTPTQYRKKVEI